MKTQKRSLHCLLVMILLVTAGFVARGQIVLTNYSAANPLKIMAFGDSITDDCMVAGAWRKPLQPLLETNGFPFTFVGRNTSPTGLLGFTKLKHEGHCGATVAAPGLFSDGRYSTTLNYLQYIAPHVFTNTMPDVMLILIGANDIGNGRNPWVVATNHMDTLLSIIFSNAPNVTVVLAKATREENYPGDSVNGTNIPIYNAMLQAVVNQRRALGQKVCLADLYSTVSYPANFSDGLHPSNSGLQQAANEWLARLQTITTRTNLIVTNFIYGGADWKFNDTGQDLGTNWAQPTYDDSGWSNGVARLGYGDPATATTVSFGPLSSSKYVTTYFRHPFVVPQNTVITNLNLRVAQADGVVVWLNGQEIYRTNLPAGPIAFTNQALNTISYYPRYNFNPTNVPVNLSSGTNWIAAEVHLKSLAATAMGFDMELIGTGHPPPPPSLSIGWADSNNLALNWPLSSGSNFSLYSATSLAPTDAWTLITDSIYTNGNQISVTQAVDSSAKFFRLQQP